MQLIFKRTYPIFRPWADFGTLLFLRILSPPFFPFTYFKKRYVFECFPMSFKDERHYKRMSRRNKIAPGAVWDIGVFGNYRTGADGRALAIMTPYGMWHMDERSATCTRRHDRRHRCWVRHGAPESGDLQIDKQGNTCESGAGSLRIRSDDGKSLYHARLMKGVLVEIPFF